MKISKLKKKKEKKFAQICVRGTYAWSKRYARILDDVYMSFNIDPKNYIFIESTKYKTKET